MSRILILEDEVDLARLYQMVLERSRHEVVGVHSDPRCALAMEDLDPEVVILDERLSGLSGTAFLPEIRSRWPEARIVLATADPDVAGRATELGADAARRKPFSLKELVATVAELAPTNG